MPMGWGRGLGERGVRIRVMIRGRYRREAHRDGGFLLARLQLVDAPAAQWLYR